MQVKGDDRERAGLKKYYLEKLNGQEYECWRSLSRTKARLEIESGACPVEHTHKQSAVRGDDREEI